MKLFENAQKKVLEGVNDRLQNQTMPGLSTPQSTSVDPGFETGPNRQAAPCRAWIDPNSKPIACILCIHGLGLQSNSYEYFGQEQSKRGLAVYAIDVRGFGSWMNAKGKSTVNFNECLEDIKQTLESIKAANPGLPVYVLGESMGGAIALRAASQYPDLVDGLISSVPAGERFNQGKTSAKVFVNLLTGTDLANVGGDILSQATKNMRLRSQWQNDPLARLNLSPQELIQFQVFMNDNHEAAKRVANMPVLIVQGTGDQLVKPEGTWELFGEIAAKDKSFFAVPGEHLIFEEAQTQNAGVRDQNFRVISSWLSAKVGHRPHRGRWSGQGGRNFGTSSQGNFGSSAAGNTDSRGFGRQMSFVNTQGLEGPVSMMDSGNYNGAISELQRIEGSRRNDPNVLSLLGRAYFQSGQRDKAVSYFRQAMVSRKRGGSQAQALNSFLLSLGQNGVGTGSVIPASNSASYSASSSPFAYIGDPSARGGYSTTSTATTSGAKGTLYAFYANWAEQCKGMSSYISQLESQYGDRVNVQAVDIEDATAEPLIEKYKVGPIPTAVFVGPDGKVVSTIIGESSYQNYEAAIRSIANSNRYR